MDNRVNWQLPDSSTPLKDRKVPNTTCQICRQAVLPILILPPTVKLIPAPRPNGHISKEMNPLKEQYAHYDILPMRDFKFASRHHSNCCSGRREISIASPSKRSLRITDTDHFPRHQLIATTQDCSKCCSATGMSVVCTDADCEFSFDLCFECAEFAATRDFEGSQPRTTAGSA
jgi:hypothetical protein